MQKSFSTRLVELERLEAQRADAAITWALDELTEDEWAYFIAFWERDQRAPGLVPAPGPEAAAVTRYCELAELRYAQL